ncbi:hypothetical protein [Dokdonia sp.]|uniref:hypothetical protein n=1 Tax=Dokdonia sp. TaxID=2024995 RepID=UPI0032652D7A
MKKELKTLKLKTIKISNLSNVQGGLKVLVDIPTSDNSLGCSFQPQCHPTDSPTFAFTCA